MLQYELWIDQGTLGSSFSKVASYVDKSLVYTLHTATDPIVSGSIYSFMYRAINVIGASYFSPAIRYAIA